MCTKGFKCASSNLIIWLIWARNCPATTLKCGEKTLCIYHIRNNFLGRIAFFNPLNLFSKNQYFSLLGLGGRKCWPSSNSSSSNDWSDLTCCVLLSLRNEIHLHTIQSNLRNLSYQFVKNNTYRKFWMSITFSCYQSQIPILETNFEAGELVNVVCGRNKIKYSVVPNWIESKRLITR